MRSTKPEILAAFRERKVRCTPQRYVILDYLLRSHDHPTAEDIHQSINRSDPRASLATVYKSLHSLAKAGLIREVVLEGNAARFESNTKRHHHFVCERCGRVEDVEWFDVPQVAKRTTRDGRKVAGYELVLRGLCRACA